MDKILTVRQPWASALVHGLKKHEYRPWRIKPGVRVWIHAGIAPGLIDLPAYLDSIDPVAGAYARWMATDDESPRPDISASALAGDMYHASGRFGLALPMGYVVGWCVFGEAQETPESSEECKFGKFANPVEQFHALDPEAWKMHKGSLGLTPYGGA